jgi:tyrosine-protein kinase Etk/Wzc
VRSTTVENLDIITRGNIHTNPSELLMSAKFAEMVSEIIPKYDIVLIDTPPLVAVTDASINGA